MGKPQQATFCVFKAQVLAELGRGRSVLVTGPAGAGRSHLLKAVAGDLPRCIYVPQVGGAKKQLLLDLARRLFEDKQLEEYAYYADWDDVRKSLNRLPVGELADAISPALVGYMLAIDELDRATEKAIKEVVLPFVEAGITLLLAGDKSTQTKETRVNLVANRCLGLEMPRMLPDEARSMLWSLLDKTSYHHWQAIEAKILNLYNGKPGIVADLAAQLEDTDGSLGDIRNLTHSELPTFDLTLITVLVGLAMLMGARFFARGLEDPTLYIVAGMAYATTVVIRPFLYSMRN
jgi:hypothetical protein